VETMDVPGISRPVLVGLIVVAAIIFLFGGTKAIALFTEHTDTHTRVVAAAPSIVVDVRTGDVRVVATDRDDIRLTTKEKRSAWGGGHVEVAGDGARLHLGDRCDKVPLVDAPCSVSYVLEVPRRTAVRLAAGTGDLHAENLEGAADLRSGTGDLHVEGARGVLRLKADTGDVDVEGAAPDVSVQTGTGDVAIVASEPRTIAVQTGTGDINIVVPDESYAVDVQSDAGDDHVGVDRDDASPRRIDAHAGTGDVHVEPGL
jgi:putative adhesin